MSEGGRGSEGLSEEVHTVDVNKMFTKSFTEHVSIIVHQISKHELVTSVGELQCFDVNFL